MVARPSPSLRQTTGTRARQMQAHRFLHNPKVTVAEMAQAVGAETARRCQGRHIAVIQDTCEVWTGGKQAKRRGFGPIGKGGATRGILAHAALAVDAGAGLLGLIGMQVWTRQGGKRQTRRRPFESKESFRWLKTADEAQMRLAAAASVTLVSDAESDIYELLALRPEGQHVLVRSARDRRLADGRKLRQAIAAAEPLGVIERPLAAAPGRKPRPAVLEVRAIEVAIAKPGDRPKALAKQVPLTALSVREVAAPKGVKPIAWLLLTSHALKTLDQAAEIADLYRSRFFIEQYFHTLKTAGFDIEAARIESPPAFIAFATMALIASATIMMLVKARDGSDAALSQCFPEADQPLLHAISQHLEGKTKKQQNPHPKTSLAFAAWVIARLGGWDGYYGKPGAKTMRQGLERYHAIKLGAEIATLGSS